MKTNTITFFMGLMLVVCPAGLAQTKSDRENNASILRSDGKPPVVLGHGVGLFEIGPLLVRDDFEDLDDWVIQIEARSGFAPPRVEARNHTLDCLLPGRGSTVWYKEKLSPRVAIVYDVVCPTHKPAIEGVQPRDVNNFWMATDPAEPDRGLFDPPRYTGKFGSYDKIQGYYASTGGRNNETTRMRRYPREAGGDPVEHVALNDKDGKPDFLITPDKVMTVQLVAYDDVIQYIVDGKLNYQFRRGDNIQVESRDSDGQLVHRDAVYDLDLFPVYEKGYFGFRMVGTHHIYSNFRVYALKPAESSALKDDSRSDSEVYVSSLRDLCEAVRKSNQSIRMKPGRYQLTDLPRDSRVIACAGSDNKIVLNGVHVSAPVGCTRQSYITISGDNNTFTGGVFEDVYSCGLERVTNFSDYNKDRSLLARGLRGAAVFSITGDGNTVVSTKLTVRGSFPYGYGSLYGIGSDNVYGLDKRCGILIRGRANTIDGCEVQQRAFGHGIYMQKPADRTVIRNSLVEGVTRSSKDLYSETDPEDLPVRSKYAMPLDDNQPIPRDVMLPLAEDGIRVYTGGGSVTVDNCTVRRMRGGIRLYLASAATITNSTAVDCGQTNFNLPSKGKIIESSGNFAYAPLSDFRLSRSRQHIELTILPSPHAVGSHNLADIMGDDHNIVFRRCGSSSDTMIRPIVVSGDNSTINNETQYPILLEPTASGNTVISAGPVIDRGMNNQITNATSP